MMKLAVFLLCTQVGTSLALPFKGGGTKGKEKNIVASIPQDEAGTSGQTPSRPPLPILSEGSRLGVQSRWKDGQRE
jgi:hypothetical protein